MSRLEDISNQFKARAEQMATRIQDSEIYQKLAERYQGLTPQGQRIATFAVIGILIFIVLFQPMTTYFTSQDKITTFEIQRDLIKDLFKTYREANKDAGVSSPPPADMLMSQINGQLQSNQLLPEQIQSVTIASSEGKLIPDKFIRDVIHVQLAKLNLRQIVDIGTVLNRLSEAVKMKDLNISARSDMNGYFDVTYKLYALNIPEQQIAVPPNLDEPPRRKAQNSGKDSAAGGDE